MSTMNAWSSLALVAGSAADGEPTAAISDRPGGLLPCDDLAGQAMPARHADLKIYPRADGQPTALFFEHESGGPNPGPR